MITWSALSGLSGCASSAQRATDLIAAQRECDAGLVSGLRWVVECAGSEPLPAACEKPGTEAQAECQDWARQQIQGAGERAAMFGAAGVM